MSNILINVSTHFRWVAETSDRMTSGKVYTILKWERDGFHFLDNLGMERRWSFLALGVEDYPFHRNLKKILE